MRPWIGKIPDRPYEGGCRRGQPLQSRDGPAPQDSASDNQGRCAEPGAASGRKSVLSQYSRPSVDTQWRSSASSIGQLVRIRRNELPCHAGGVFVGSKPVENPNTSFGT